MDADVDADADADADADIKIKMKIWIQQRVFKFLERLVIRVRKKGKHPVLTKHLLVCLWRNSGRKQTTLATEIEFWRVK